MVSTILNMVVGLVLVCQGFAADSPPIAMCLPSYEMMPGIGCYKGHKMEVTFDQAEGLCQTEGTHLAVPNSKEEHGAIFVIGKALGQRPWMGIKKVGDHWYNVEGQEHGADDGYTGWSSGQPDGWGPCAYIGSDGMSNDKCTMSRPFICEQRSSPCSTSL